MTEPSGRRPPRRGKFRAAISLFVGGVVSFCGCGSGDADVALEHENPGKAPIVVVLNGCGVTGSARVVAEAILKAGYDIGNGHGDNAESFGFPNTLVVDYVGQMAVAKTLARRLGCPAIQQVSHDPDRFGTIGVVVGADYRERLAELSGG